MNAEIARFIIDFIENIHLYYHEYSHIAIFVFFATFLPKRYKFESKYDKFFTYLQLLFLIHLVTVFLSQGIFGGCAYHPLQNYLAREYLGMEGWYPFGVVFREKYENNFSGDYIWLASFLLQMFYLFAGLWIAKRTRLFYNNRIKTPNLSKGA